MSAHNFNKHKQFEWEDAPYKVIERLVDGRLNIQNMQTNEMRTVAVRTLIFALFNGKLQFAITSENSDVVLPHEHAYPTLDDCDPVLRVVAEHREWIILPLLKQGRYTKNDVRARVTAVKEMIRNSETPIQHKQLSRQPKMSVSVRSIYRWIDLYKKSNCDIRALIPHSKSQGGKSKTRTSDRAEAIMVTTIEEMALKRLKYTVDDIHQEINLRIHEENMARPKADALIAPSRSTVARRIEKLGLMDLFAARRGKREAYYEHTQFASFEMPNRPLLRVEIDHTRLDVITNDEETGNPLSRPTLTMCIDVATRYPLGYYLGFEPPSYYTVMQCLYHAIMPKGDVKAKYGTDNEWLAFGVPRTLVIDNGKEFIGKDLEDACNQLGILLQNTPAYMPHLKATIERQFGTLNTGLFHKTSGTTFSNTAERGDYNSMKESHITLTKLDQVIHWFLLDVYAATFHRGLDGIPARRWQAYVDDGFEPRLPPSARELWIMLGSVEQRVIHRGGVELHTLRYNCSELALLRSRLKGDPVKVKYNRGDLSHIYVFDPFETKYIKVPALAQQYTQGLSLWMHKVIRNNVMKEKAQTDLESMARTKRKIRAVVDNDLNDPKKKTRQKSARWETQGQTAQNLHFDTFDEPVPVNDERVDGTKTPQPKPDKPKSIGEPIPDFGGIKVSFTPEELEDMGFSTDE